MKKSYLIKGLAVGIICLFMLVIVTYNVKSFDFPPEEGPYTVYVAGISRGFGYNIDEEEYFSHKFPLWNLEFPDKISYHFGFLTVFIVNGEIHRLTFPESKISFYGFKGFAPTIYIYAIKCLTLVGRIRVIGQCDAINVM
jgi:hypothetical protein